MTARGISVLCLLLLIASAVIGQSKRAYKGFPSLVWPKLYDIQFEKATDASGEYEKPIFSGGARSLHGKSVTLPGFMVPFENGIKGAHFMLSSLPLNACFFCGVGGPETVVEIFLREEARYTERPVEVTGVLKLNDKDPDKMIYILENATISETADF
ncbi:MAG: hypothetical protein ACOYXT_15440 [Bacteroidota bacterium]